MENLNDKFKDQQYDFSEYDNNQYDNYQQPQKSDKSMKGLKIMIVILAVILAGLSYMYYAQVQKMKIEYNEQKDELTAELTGLMETYDGLKTNYDTVNQNLSTERGRVDSLMQTIKKERNISRAKIREYESQISKMRVILTQSYETIDSLNKANQVLVQDNQRVRMSLASANLRADKNEERAGEQEIKLRQGSAIKVRGINITAINNNDRAVSRANNATKLRVDCELTANELSNPGIRRVFVRIIGPDGYVLPNPSNDTFNYEGDMVTYSAVRESVDYQNADIPIAIYYAGQGITAGTYKVLIYVDGRLGGQTEKILR